MKNSNVDNLSECLQVTKQGSVRVFCVECNDWSTLVVLAKAVVQIRPARDFPFGVHVKEYDSVFDVCCGLCFADVKYLFEHNREVAKVFNRRLKLYGMTQEV